MRFGSMPRFERRGGHRVFLCAVALGTVRLAFHGTASPSLAPNDRFVNVGRAAGLEAMIYAGGPHKDHILESTGSGAALVDIDGDGQPDIFLVNGWALEEEPSRVKIKGRNALYRNRGQGGFEDSSHASGLDDDGWGCGVCAGDYDNDGRLDLYVSNFGPNRLFRNRGDGSFEQVAEQAGVADAGWGAGCAFFDAEGDGDLDLYVANYIECSLEDVLAARRANLWQNKAKVMVGPFGLRGGKDRFYRNDGAGRFADATDQAGLTDLAEGYGLGVLASDFDADGDTDVYVANDSNPNYFYRNDGGGRFTEIGAWNGAAYDLDGAAQASMGVEAGDLDGDGLEELLVTNFARDHTTLYHNLGDLFFEDISGPQRLKETTYLPLSWGCAFFDFDLDADLDIVIVNGHIYPQVDDFPELGEHYRQRPLLLRNDSGRLVDVSDRYFTGADLVLSARGLAVGDYDDDGDPDLLITGMDSPALLLRNDLDRSAGWIKLRLLNRYGSPALGARVKLEAQGRRQLRELRSGSTYQSQSALELHFGLGQADRVERIEVRWPGGRTSVLQDISARRTLTLREPTT